MADRRDHPFAVEALLEEYPDRYPDAVQPVLDYLHVLCGGNPALYGCVLRWHANLLQGRENGPALVLYGGEGTGKTLWLQFLTAIAGRRLVAVDDAVDDTVDDVRGVLIASNRNLAVPGAIRARSTKPNGIERFARAVRDPRAQVEFFRRMCEHRHPEPARRSVIQEANRRRAGSA